MKDWKLTYRGFDPEQEALRETLCTLGNGYFATRGAAAEARADDTHYPGTYVAGCFNRLQTRIQGRVTEDESLVNVPNWLSHCFRLPAGEWFDLYGFKILDYQQELDLNEGIFSRHIRFQDAAGRHTRIEEQRLVSMYQPHLGAISTRIFAEDWDGTIEVRTCLDGEVANTGVARYRDLNSDHLEPVAADSLGNRSMALEVATNQSHIHIAMAAGVRFWQGNVEVEPKARVEKGPKSVKHYYDIAIANQQSVLVEKVAALYTSRDRAISEPGLEARKNIFSGHRFDDLAQPHKKTWRRLWDCFNLDFRHEDPVEEEETERILRLHIFHLLQTYSPHTMDLDAGVPARGLHGEAYRGHIFWDELFVLPLFHLRWPAISRAHLLYRYRRLGQARRDARAAGYQGAMYPWQSGSDGREESQRLHLNPKSGNWLPDNSRLQRHIGSAVVFNICHYYQATGDYEFLSLYGAEMILEVARFWASKATYNSDRERYDILEVMGPDEYHDSYPDSERPGLDNNAYTNVMAAWVLGQALALADRLATRRFQDLCDILHISQEELAQWDSISRKIYVPFHDSGIISQFEGYEKLLAFDWEGYREKYRDIQRLDRLLEAEGDSPNRYQASKQADVLMLFYLFSAEELGELFERLGYPFDQDTIPRNIDYYRHRTSHGSTLSRVTHSWVLARANREESWSLFKEALRSDVDDTQGGTTTEGIHAGAMAGTVDVVQRCFTGLEVRRGILRLNPSLPKGLRSLAFNIRYRNHDLALSVTPREVRLEVSPSDKPPIRVAVEDDVVTMNPGETREFGL